LWYGRLGSALFIFIGAGLTDLLDGWIARRFNQRSRVGAILDPAADKLMMLTAFILMSLVSTLEISYRIPVWVAISPIRRLSANRVTNPGTGKMGSRNCLPKSRVKVSLVVGKGEVAFKTP
ncbi:MAG: CDP-alcohol phosphatidyltransferase family protein, partial [Holophagaceae bacterium]